MKDFITLIKGIVSLIWNIIFCILTIPAVLMLGLAKDVRLISKFFKDTCSKDVNNLKPIIEMLIYEEVEE